MRAQNRPYTFFESPPQELDLIPTDISTPILTTPNGGVELRLIFNRSAQKWAEN